jgi:hypothetical protein
MSKDIIKELEEKKKLQEKKLNLKGARMTQKLIDALKKREDKNEVSTVKR